jgi:U3 small nucleolar RNA-associated protein 19
MRGDVVELLELLARSKIGRRFGRSFASRDQSLACLGKLFWGKENREDCSAVLHKTSPKMTATKDSGQPVKRKRVSTVDRPLKRARSESSDEDAEAQILLLENDIFASKKNYNNIVKLVNKLETPDEAVIAAISLCRVFTRLMVSGDMTKRKDTTDKDAVVIGWLRERYKDYKSGLIVLLGAEEIAATMLTLCMRLLQSEGKHLRSNSEHSFPESFLADIVRVLVEPGSDQKTRLVFSRKYVEEYDDVRYYTLDALELVIYPIIEVQV